MTSREIIVNLKDKSYSAFVGSGLIENISSLKKNWPSKTAFVISDKALVKARIQLSSSLKKSGWTVREIPVNAGESLKEIQSTYPIYGQLLNLGARRDSVIFALGGGSLGDAAGFVASTFLRGLKWVSVPTTLLAQVDSGLGGKTAINHKLGKNLIGTFHQPTLVVCEVSFLKTLSKREMISGLGEALKYGFIYDVKFFNFIKQNWQGILIYEEAILGAVVEKSLQWKAKAVSLDEFDIKGKREFLNFGHTFGHALEGLTHYKKYQHGEAVIWGMRFALELSRIRRHITQRNYEVAAPFLWELPVPSLPKTLDFKKVLTTLSHDKKFRKGSLHFVLLKKLGQAVSDSHVTENDLRLSFEALKAKV